MRSTNAKSITFYELAWELYRSGVKPDEIAVRIGKHRATIYRWLKGIRYRGIRRFVREKKEAKRKRKRRCLDAITVKRIKRLRDEYGWCGEKIVFWLKLKYETKVSRSSVYRVLNRDYQLRPVRGHKNRKRGPVPQADAPQEVIQLDTVDLGELYLYVGIDIYTREAAVFIGEDLSSQEGARALTVIMQTFGYSKIIQTDNGPEFEGEFAEGVKLFSNQHRYIRPYRKNENAYVESFIRSLRRECVGWVAYRREEKTELQRMVDTYLLHYHLERPHLSLKMLSPHQYVESLKVLLSHLR
jgi:transposase InsO family protein